MRYEGQQSFARPQYCDASWQFHKRGERRLLLQQLFSSPLHCSALRSSHVHPRNGGRKASIARRRYTSSLTGSWARASHSSRSGSTSSIVRAFPARACDSIPSLGADSTSVECRNTNPQTLMWDIPGKKKRECGCYRVPLRVDDGTVQSIVGRKVGTTVVRRHSSSGSSRTHPPPAATQSKTDRRLISFLVLATAQTI